MLNEYKLLKIFSSTILILNPLLGSYTYTETIIEESELTTTKEQQKRPYKITDSLHYDFGANFGYSALKSTATSNSMNGVAGGIQANLKYYLTESNLLAIKLGFDLSGGYYTKVVPSPAFPDIKFNHTGTIITPTINLLLEVNPWKELYLSAGAGIGYAWFKESMDRNINNVNVNYLTGDYNHELYKLIASISYRVTDYALLGVKYEYWNMDFLKANNVSVFLSIPY